MTKSRSVYRILDASLNRCAEGLRTLEEAGRFVLDSEELASCFKELRHELTAIARSIPRLLLLRSRDTPSDVGIKIQASDEYERQNLGEVIAAAASRVQQSLRVLEEYGKVLEPSASKRIEQIRYRLYTASAKLEISLSQSFRKQRLDDSYLYLLTDAGASDEDFEKRMILLTDSVVDVVQLRDRSVSDRVLLRRAQIGVKIMRDAGKLLVVNDRADLAIAADADGVHVGQDEMPVQQARRIMGEDRLIGVSTHQLSEAHQAVVDGADYLGCGPVFPSQTKSFDHFPGVDFLTNVAAEVAIPCFAIGGIEQANLQQVMETGFKRIAVAGALNRSADIVKSARSLKDRIMNVDSDDPPIGNT